MNTDSELSDDIRAAKCEALKEAQQTINLLYGAEAKSPTARRGISAARKAVSELSKKYRSDAQVAADNAAYRAARDGGSPRGPAFVSADMKPDKIIGHKKTT